MRTEKGTERERERWKAKEGKKYHFPDDGVRREKRIERRLSKYRWTLKEILPASGLQFR